MGVKGFDVMSIAKVNLFNPKEVGYEDSIDIIHDELHKTRKSFIKIGWYLKHIEGEKMYLQEGYDNIVDFSKDKFNLSQPTTNRFIRLCEEFSVDHNSPELDEKYANYSVSQLIEMVSMKPEQLEQISAEMTVREIKEIKKPSKKAIKDFYDLFVRGTEYENKRDGLKEYFIDEFGRSGCGGYQGNVSYKCSRRGISLNNSSEITWTNLVKEINELFPVKNHELDEDDNIPGQTSIEKDFPEYRPEAHVSYATSHKENEDNVSVNELREDVIVDGCFREINSSKVEETYTAEQRLMIEGMDMLLRKFKELPDDTNITVKELIEESNKVYEIIRSKV